MVVNTPKANANSPQISQQGIELYKRMLEDTVFIKRQQWATTNYATLIYAAIIWLSQHTSMNPLLRCVLFVVTILVGVIASALLVKFQCELAKLRQRRHGMRRG